MERFHHLSCWDIKDDLWVFHARVSDTKVQLRPEYRDLVTPCCGRGDKLAALERGIHSSVRGPRNRCDAAYSRDLVDLVSRRCLEVLDKVAPGTLRRFQLPGDKDYYAVYPVRILCPPDSASVPAYPITEFRWRRGDVFRRDEGGRCPVCGRDYVACNDEEYRVPDDVTLAAMLIDQPNCFTWFSWIANDAVVNALEKAKLRGWRIKKNAFANSRAGR
jgi:hypothetical protein